MMAAQDGTVIIRHPLPFPVPVELFHQIQVKTHVGPLRGRVIAIERPANNAPGELLLTVDNAELVEPTLYDQDADERQ